MIKQTKLKIIITFHYIPVLKQIMYKTKSYLGIYSLNLLLTTVDMLAYLEPLQG